MSKDQGFTHDFPQQLPPSFTHVPGSILTAQPYY